MGAGARTAPTSLVPRAHRWEGAGIFDDEALERYDVALDEGTHALAEALALLEQESVRDDFDRFSEALRADVILPEDF